MSAAKPKFFIANRHTSRIAHRKLDTYEERALARGSYTNISTHATWDEAHAVVVAARSEDVKRLRHKLKLAEGALVRAKAMKAPGGAA